MAHRLLLPPLTVFRATPPRAVDHVPSNANHSLLKRLKLIHHQRMARLMHNFHQQDVWTPTRSTNSIEIDGLVHHRV